jgi:hypothetical protein
MSTPTQTAGETPVFPNAYPFPPSYDINATPHFGITMRDYIAIHANEKDVEWFIISRGFDRGAARYAFADAMLAARKQAGGFK